MVNDVFTIGHSTHPIERFISLLQKHAISVVADVRSAPFSRHNPQFNRDTLRSTLLEMDIRYVFLGKELGARSDDPDCYVGSKVQYRLLARTPQFQSGIDRVLDGAASHRIALMCAEKDPLECHRTILVARELVKRGPSVKHILPSGNVESHADALNRLMIELHMPAPDFFRSEEDLQAQCYSMQAEKIAYDRGARPERDVSA